MDKSNKEQLGQIQLKTISTIDHALHLTLSIFRARFSHTSNANIIVSENDVYTLL